MVLLLAWYALMVCTGHAAVMKAKVDEASVASSKDVVRESDVQTTHERGWHLL